jgi:hypothetical protein
MGNENNPIQVVAHNHGVSRGIIASAAARLKLNLAPFEGFGNPNLYPFVQNDPINRVDPSGLMTVQEIMEAMQEAYNAGNTAEYEYWQEELGVALEQEQAATAATLQAQAELEAYVAEQEAETSLLEGALEGGLYGILGIEAVGGIVVEAGAMLTPPPDVVYPQPYPGQVNGVPVCVTVTLK